MKKSLLLFCLPLLLVVSCASSGGSGSGSGAIPKSASSGSSSATVRSVDDWVSDSTRDNGYVTDAEGNLKPKSNKRSSFETKGESAYFKGDYAKKEFKTQDVSKKSWWGDTKYESKKFEGDTDGSRFQTASGFQGKGAREAGSTARETGDYKTSNYVTTSARENGKSRLGRPSDAETDARRRVYTAPSIIDWREQRAMSVNETKGFLGR